MAHLGIWMGEKTRSRLDIRSSRVDICDDRTPSPNRHKHEKLNKTNTNDKLNDTASGYARFVALY